MAIRTVLASLTAISVLFVGVFAMSESAQQAEPTLNTTAANESYSVAEQVFTGMGQAGTGIVWFGIAAIVVVALGFLVMSAGGGR